MATAEDKIVSLRKFIDAETNVLNRSLLALKDERTKLREAVDPDIRRYHTEQIDVHQGVALRARAAIDFARSEMSRIDNERLSRTKGPAEREPGQAAQELREYGASTDRKRGLGRELVEARERDSAMERELSRGRD